MNKHGITRIVSVLTGAAVLFGLELGFGVQYYFAIPAGVLVYIILRMTLDQVLGPETPVK